MELLIATKKLFVKNNNLPIALFKEPFFRDRLKLMERQFGAYTKFMSFLKELEQFPNEQAYLEYNNQVRNDIISFIKEQPAYETFNQFDIQTSFPLQNYQVKKQGVYKKENIGKTLLSIDLKSANYTALRKFDTSLVKNTTDYESFIASFVKEESIIQSKHLRQVIFGNLNNKRLFHIQSYFIQQLVPIIEHFFSVENILSFVTDEVVIDITEKESQVENLKEMIDEKAKKLDIPLKIETYVLKGITKIENGEVVLSDFYMKDFQNGAVEFKGISPLFYPIILKKYYGEPLENSDKMFFHEGHIAQFVEDIEFFV